MIAIAAAERNWGIGYRGQLLVHIREDLKNFSRLTKNRIVICGRKTIETFPGGKPLKDRINIIMTRNPSFHMEQAVTAHSTEELFQLLRSEYPSFSEDEVFVIGGAEIYRQLIPFCSRAILTRIDHEFPSDAWFPDLEKEPGWILANEGEKQEADGILFHFDTWTNQSVQK